MGPHDLSKALTIFAAMISIGGADAADAPTQAYPSKLIRVIVPFPAGGTADVLPRLIGEKLAARWGQPIVIENHPGAGGNIGAQLVANADPDGYTILSSPPAPLVINHNLYRKLAFDPRAFVPVTIIASVPNVLVVNPKVPANTVQELIAYARDNPGKLNYASQGSGTTSHLTAAMFQALANVTMVHIPYKGTAPALTDLLGGQVDLMFDNLSSSLPYIKTGKLKLLGVGGAKRVASLPDAPTIAESGLPNFYSVTWFGMVAPPKTPNAVADKLSAAVADVLKMPGVARRLTELNADPVASTPAEMVKFMKDDEARWLKVIRSASVKVE
ncbi:MAG: tripartite tricarboxylate transporter substrate binding protein [Burkholderiales bacterium]|nr:tripartite tricarboxylate transporter substrate binding protein [Burkholderiales bacterium]